MALRSTLTTDRIKKKYPKGVPYDFSCPVLSQDVIKQRICQHCGLYLSSLKAKSLHITSCRIDKNNHDRKATCATNKSRCSSTTRIVVCNGISRNGVGFNGRA